MIIKKHKKSNGIMPFSLSSLCHYIQRREKKKTTPTNNGHSDLYLSMNPSNIRQSLHQLFLVWSCVTAHLYYLSAYGISLGRPRAAAPNTHLFPFLFLLVRYGGFVAKSPSSLGIFILFGRFIFACFSWIFQWRPRLKYAFFPRWPIFGPQGYISPALMKLTKSSLRCSSQLSHISNNSNEF